MVNILDNQIFDKALPLAQAMAHQSMITSRTFSRFADQRFIGREGDVVNLRVRSPLSVRSYDLYNNRAQPIKADFVEETLVPLKVDANRLYQATEVRQEVFDFDFNRPGTTSEQEWNLLLRDQVLALSNEFDERCSLVVQNAPFEYVKHVDASAQKIKEQRELGRDVFFNALTDARNALTRMGSPLGVGNALYAIAGSNWASELQKNQKLAIHSGTGDDDAFASSVIGTYAGITVVQDLTINPDELYLYTKDAFLQWTSAPKIPPAGVNVSHTSTQNGLALTHVMDYDPARLIIRSIFTAYTAFGFTPDVVGVRDVNGQNHISTDTYFIRGAKLILGTGTDIEPGNGNGSGPGASADSYLAKLFKGGRIDAPADTSVFLDTTYQNVVDGNVSKGTAKAPEEIDGIRSVPARTAKKPATKPAAGK